MNTFIYGGHRVCYREEGRGIPMIFLHNGGNDHRIWDFQATPFSKSCRVIAPDHPGYGMSDKPRIDYSLDFYTDYLRAFIEHLGVRRPVLVGNCIGSAMALRYALENPGKVRALVLFNLATENTLRHGIFGPLYRITLGSPRARRVIARAAETRGVSRAARMMGFRILYGKTGDPDESFRHHLAHLYSSRDQLPVLYSLLSNFASFRGLDSAAKPEGFPPCCMIWGKQNHVLSAESGAEFNAAFGPEESRMIDGCGHMVMREKFGEVNRIMSDFLDHSGAFAGGSE